MNVTTTTTAAPEIDIPAGYWQREASHNPRPLSTLGANVFIDGVSQSFPKVFAEFGMLLEALEYREIGGYAYNSIVPFGGRSDRALPPKFLLWIALRTAPAIRKRLKRCKAALAQRLDRQIVERWYGEWRPKLTADIERFRAVDLESLTDADLAVHFDELLGWTLECFDIHFYLSAPYGLHLYRITSFCERHLGYDDLRTMRLLAGLSAASSEPAIALARLSDAARGDDGLVRDVLAAAPRDVPAIVAARGGAAAAAAYADYVRRYGFRALRYEVYEQSMYEHPELIASLLQDDLRRPFGVDAEQGHLAQERATAKAEALAALPPKLHARFLDYLADAERSYPTREDNEFFTVSVPLAIFRLAAQEAGRRLVRNDVLAIEDDVYFLRVDEITGALRGPHPGDALAEQVERRREAFDAAQSFTPPLSYGVEPASPDLGVLPPYAREVMQAMLFMSERIFDAELEGERDASDDPRSVSGRPAARGTYTGPVRIIMGEHEFDKLQAGDVLVSPITSPVWSVLFAKVGALVTDTGGILSHPAIIAREYRIPAVVATRNGTERLRDGQRVTVDGDTGVVSILD